MSKSLKRVKRALESFGHSTEVRETGEARMAQMAADELEVDVDQIAKSIIFKGETTGEAILFLTAGGNQVDVTKASDLAEEPLGKADAALVRIQTGFAIGGVSPIGHKNPIRCWIDPHLLKFEVVWAAAGTPHHVFSSTPNQLANMSGAKTADFTVTKIM